MIDLAFDPRQPIVKLSAGDDAEIVNVHQDIICQTSTFFKNAMKPEWANQRADPYTIDLSDHDVSVVTLYVRWLYSATISIASTAVDESDEDKKFEEVDTLFDILVHAYIFGEKVIDPVYTKAVLGELIKLQLTHLWTPGPGVMCTLYEGTLPGCLARRLMTQFVAHHCHFQEPNSVWHEEIAGYPRELLMDVVKVMSTLRPDTDDGPDPDPWSTKDLDEYLKHI